VGTWRGARGRRGQRAASGWEALTPTEIKIAALVAGGDPTSDIARGMFVSRRTVRTYISRILVKLGAKGRVEIVREALRQGRLALAGRTNRRSCGKVSSHDHYSQPGAAGCLGLCPVLGTGQAAGRDMHRMTQPGLLWASVRRRRITSATLPGDAT
jgi:DNA-binding CsgD family transcriptional regulator